MALISGGERRRGGGGGGGGGGKGGGGLRKRPTASNGFPFIQFTPAFRSINAIADTAATAITSKPTPKMLHTDTHTHTRGGMDKKRNENAE